MFLNINSPSLLDFLPLSLEVLVDCIHKIFSDDPMLFFFDIPSVESCDGKILSHDSLLNCLNSGVFKNMGEFSEKLVIIELCSMS